MDATGEEEILNVELLVRSSLPLIVVDKTTGAFRDSGNGVLVRFRDNFFICTVDHLTSIPNTTVNLLTGARVGNMAIVYALEDFSNLRRLELKTNSPKELEYVLNAVPEKEDFLDIAFKKTTPLQNLVQTEIIVETGTGPLRIPTCPRTFLQLDDYHEPDPTEIFGFFATIHQPAEDGKYHMSTRLPLGLTFIKKHEDFIEFDLGEPIGDHDRFHGCSGAPILDREGRLVALLSHGDSDITSSSIYGFALTRLKRYIEYIYFTGIPDQATPVNAS